MISDSNRGLQSVSAYIIKPTWSVMYLTLILITDDYTACLLLSSNTDC